MKPSLASRVVAVLFLSLLAGWLTHVFDQHALSRASTMTDTEIAEHYRSIHGHAFAFAAFGAFMMGLIYMLCVEFVSNLVRAVWRKMDPKTMAAA